MYLLADVGGTKMRIAASSDLESFTEPIILDTPDDRRAGIEALTDAARRSANGGRIDKAVIGVPGVVSGDKRSLLSARNLAGWEKENLAGEIAALVGGDVVLENDTALVGLGEALYGAGAGARIVVYMTVSTGVNAVKIIDGEIEPAAFGSEEGAQYLFIGDEPKHLNDIISGTAIEKKYGMHPKDLGKDSPVWEELAEVTAFGLYNSIVHWSPERIVLGGSMFNEIGISVDRVRAHLEKINDKYPALPEIVHSSLGAVGGLYGGLALLRGNR